MTPKLLCALFLAAVVATPAAAQTRRPVAAAQRDDPPPISFRPFFIATGQRFAAEKTFDAVFGSQVEPFFGGGLQVAFQQGLFVEVSVSRFSKTGQRAFVLNSQAFPLGIPLTATITPFEVAGGYRLRVAPRILPYIGAGVSHYAYSETSDFADTGENVDTGGTGFLVFGGLEFRAHRWVGIAVDAAYTQVKDVIGGGGISQVFGEDNLGGTAVRVRVLVGR